MARRCEVTGKTPMTGNAVSHSMRHTKRRQFPNLQTKRIWVPEEGRFVKMKLTTKALKAMSKNGVSATLAKARRKGTLEI